VSDLTAALLGGGAIAVAAGLVGYFLVLRAQVFTGDALAHVAFTGAMAALALGVDLRAGLYVGTVAIALLMAALGVRALADDVVIGAVFSWVLGLGSLFLSLYTTSRSTANGNAGVSVLFGSVLGMNAAQAWTAVGVSCGVSVLMLVLARPLLFASLDPVVAAARGVPVRLLNVLFLVVVGVAAAVTVPVAGTLLIFSLMVGPAAAAARLTRTPATALLVSVALGLAATWLGIGLAYVTGWPVGFFITAIATVFYVVTRFTHPRRTAR
jgi:zinc/manganese transport system permease protein